MTWSAGAPSSIPCSVVTQCDFQLHAMAHAIERAQQSTTEQTNSLSRLNVQRREQSLVVQAAQSTAQPGTRSLVLTPLFAGSYTQPDVAVQSLDLTQGSSATLSTDYSTDPSPCLLPPVPTLHFAQFSKLPASMKIRSTMGENTIALLATDILDPAGVEEQPLTFVRPIKEIIDKQPDSTIIVIDLQNFLQKSSWSSALQKRQRCIKLQRHARSLPGKVKVIRLPRNEVTTLVTLLRQVDIVYATSAGLTIDAVNSGCRFIMGNHPIAIQGHDAEHLNTTRRALAIEQMNRLQAHQVIQHVNELYSLLQNWLQPKGWGTRSEHLPISPIIPLNMHPALSRRSTLASGKAKLLKLQQSPRQFLQDSRYPRLRKLGMRR